VCPGVCVTRAFLLAGHGTRSAFSLKMTVTSALLRRAPEFISTSVGADMLGGNQGKRKLVKER